LTRKAEGRKLGIPYGSNPDTCPMRSLKAWLEASAIESGALFRSITRHGKIRARLSSYAVALVVKHYAGVLGLDAATYAGHSLRAGLATSAAIAGANERAIMNPGHYEPDGTQVKRHGAAVHPRWVTVPGECCGEGGAVACSVIPCSLPTARPASASGPAGFIGGAAERGFHDGVSPERQVVDIET
jgi:hypothetical protein